MFKKKFNTFLLRDIAMALLVGVKCCFKKHVTKDIDKLPNQEMRRLCIDKSKCIGCKICENTCPSGAIKIEKPGVCELDFNRCIHCRLCKRRCPKNVFN
ncbi:MAG: 4Fe-4S dicluster domain-containing protein [Holosporales bacterium]|nr:4Fe-4S dicluster domain-containing protein [Holosporales bacterium]